MKKHFWLMTIFVALALLAAGCSTDGTKDDGDGEEGEGLSAIVKIGSGGSIKDTTTASLVDQNGTPAIKVVPPSGGTEIRVEIVFDTPIDISSYSTFAFKWICNEFSGGAWFNISIFTENTEEPDNPTKTILGAWKTPEEGTVEQEISFTSDHQSWGGVIIADTSKRCTSIEIYWANDNEETTAPAAYFTSLRFK